MNMYKGWLSLQYYIAQSYGQSIDASLHLDATNHKFLRRISTSLARFNNRATFAIQPAVRATWEAEYMSEKIRDSRWFPVWNRYDLSVINARTSEWKRARGRFGHFGVVNYRRGSGRPAAI